MKKLIVTAVDMRSRAHLPMDYSSADSRGEGCRGAVEVPVAMTGGSTRCSIAGAAAESARRVRSLGTMQLPVVRFPSRRREASCARGAPRSSLSTSGIARERSERPLRNRKTRRRDRRDGTLRPSSDARCRRTCRDPASGSLCASSQALGAPSGSGSVQGAWGSCSSYWPLRHLCDTG